MYNTQDTFTLDAIHHLTDLQRQVSDALRSFKKKICKCISAIS